METAAWLATEQTRDFSRPCLFCAQGLAHPRLGICAACFAELPRNRVCCARCGLPLPAAVAMCGRCQRRPPPWDGAWVPFRYAWPLDRIMLRFKFGGELAAGAVLSALWSVETLPGPKPDWVVPIPLHGSRLRERGYNQAQELARGLLRTHQLVLQRRVLRRVRATQAQSELDAAARRRNLRRAFALTPGQRWPAHVALLDDVMTTGSTLAEAAQLLKRAGVQRVDAWVLARAAL